MRKEEKWGMAFHEVKNQEVKTLLYLEGSESQIKFTFESIKREFKRNTGNPECLVSIIDVNGGESTIDDYPLSKMQMSSVATLLGFELSETYTKNF